MKVILELAACCFQRCGCLEEGGVSLGYESGESMKKNQRKVGVFCYFVMRCTLILVSNSEYISGMITWMKAANQRDPEQTFTYVM